MESVLSTLLESDPVIAWQAHRDLLDAPEATAEAVRNTIPSTGVGRSIASALADPSQEGVDWWRRLWLLNLSVQLGFPPDYEPVRLAAHELLKPKLSNPALGDPVRLFKRTRLFEREDLCHLGFWLGIGSYYGFDQPPLERLIEILLDLQMPDGGWNCRSQRLSTTHHSAFQTTFNVLEGLREARRQRIGADSQAAEDRALEFMLYHRLFRSDRTGEVINDHFLRLSFPWHYHYRILRGMDYIRTTRFASDHRLEECAQYLSHRRQVDQMWPADQPINGKGPMVERAGRPSPMNTLIALRCLKSRN